jgi:hypothetical protein
MASVEAEWMGMEHCWDDTDRGKPKHSEKNLSQYHSAHQKSDMDWPGIQSGLPWGYAGE